MADPLAIAAESLAPAPATTNFFDPMPGQDIISRYASSKSLAEGAKSLAESASGLAASRWDRAQQRHALKSWDREDEDYQAKKAAQAGLGDVIRSLSGLKPGTPEFVQTLNGIRAEMPYEVVTDPAVIATVESLRREHTDLQDQAQRQAYQQEAQAYRSQNDLENFKARAVRAGADPAIVEGLSSKIRAAELQGEAEREYAKQKLDYSAGLRQKIAAATGQVKKRASEYESVVKGDPKAFPTSVVSLKARILEAETAKKGKPPTNLADIIKTKYQSEMDDAEARDKNRFDFEYEDARNLSEDEYVNLYGDMPKLLKEKRRALWRYANGEGSALAPEPAPEETGAPSSAPTGAGSTPQEPEAPMPPAAAAPAPVATETDKSAEIQRLLGKKPSLRPVP